MAKNKSDLTNEIAALIAAMNTPESIPPSSVALILQDIVDAMIDIDDDPLILSPISMTKAQLAAAIIGSALNDGQQITITDRADTFPLIVRALGTNNIHPFATQLVGAIPLPVMIDYLSGNEGETSPFLAFVDDNGNLNLSARIIIADASKGAGKELVSDANGKGTWLGSAYGQNSVGNPAAMTGSTMLAMGLGASITPGKSGIVTFTFSGEYTSSTTSLPTRINLATGTGIAPLNGVSLPAAAGVVMRKIMNLLASSATDRIPFSSTLIVTGLTLGTPYWIDLGIVNDDSGACQMFNVSLTAIEK